MPIQTIKTALIVPPTVTDQDPNAALFRVYPPLAQQVNEIQKAFRQLQLVVGAAAATATLTFSTALVSPYFDALYCPLAIPSWNTTVYIAAPGDLTSASVKFTFGTVAPGGGGLLYITTIR